MLDSVQGEEKEDLAQDHSFQNLPNESIMLHIFFPERELTPPFFFKLHVPTHCMPSTYLPA